MSKLKLSYILFLGGYLLLLLVNINFIPKLAGDESIYVQSTTSLMNGVIDNNNHPLLAKSIWASIVFVAHLVSGADSNIFWRFGTIIFSLSTLYVYYKALGLIFSKDVAGVLIFLLALDPMYFSFSRLVHLEIPLLFFIVCSFYFALKFIDTNKLKYLLLTSLALGLSLSVKLLAVGLILVVSVYLLLVARRGIAKVTLVLLLLLQGSAVLTGIVFGNVLFFFSNTSRLNLFQYLASLLESQVLSSPIQSGFQISSPWSWFTVPQIISLYRLNWGSGVESLIAFQSPATFMLSFISIIYSAYYLFKEKFQHKKLTLVFLYFITLYLPWFLGLHTTYYYYVLVLIPFVLIMMAKMLTDVSKKIQQLALISVEKIFFAILFTSFVLFAIYYPLLVGLRVPKKYDLMLYKYSVYSYPDFNTLFCQGCFPRK